MTASPANCWTPPAQDLAPSEHENRLVPLIAAGKASRSALAALAAEQRRIIRSDWRSFLVLASRCTEPTAASFFAGLAAGEGMALAKLARSPPPPAWTPRRCATTSRWRAARPTRRTWRGSR